MLFGKPWIHENNAPYNDIANICSFKHNDRNTKLLGMTPAEILDIELARQETKKINDAKNKLNKTNIDLSLLPNFSHFVP